MQSTDQPPSDCLARFALSTQGDRPKSSRKMARRKAVRARLSKNSSRERSLTVMDRIFLSVICAAVVLLVTAFALATPPLKSDGPLEKTLLLGAAQR
jgi:hypothetical protein